MTVLSRLVTGMQLGRHSSLQSVSLRSWFRKDNGLPNTIVSRGIRRPRGQNRKGGMNLAPQTFIEAPNEGNMGRGVLKSFLFAGAFCGTTFLAASVWQYEALRHDVQKKSWTNWANKHWNQLEGWHHKEGEFRQAINKWWNNLSEGQQVFWPICFINGIVYACWNNPSLQHVMFRYFCANPAGRVICWPMFLSTFSHFAFFHFAMNMYVLHSFSSGVGRSLGKEQFTAMYLCGGVISSLASHVFKVAVRCPGPSLGASGAIMAILGYFCTQYPDAQLGIVFIPGLSFSADYALKGVMCLDAVGMVMGWRMFDHAAHLGGALFGLFYAAYGTRYIWPKSEAIMKKWHQVRTEVKEKLDNSRKGED